MEFQPPRPRPRPRRETILPMINVVFLLLIFFLMTAQIAPAPPFDLTLPESGAEPGDLPARTLWLSADGTLAHDELRGDAALAMLAEGEGPVLIRADSAVAAADLAQLMTRLSALGVSDLRLATLSRGAP
ncbi:MAG: biopolymer transporter ExbD [Pararhodobacter sp.]|nr:biopolymer transporter ExbD [Pararhodobacter sp.]